MAILPCLTGGDRSERRTPRTDWPARVGSTHILSVGVAAHLCSGGAMVGSGARQAAVVTTVRSTARGSWRQGNALQGSCIWPLFALLLSRSVSSSWLGLERSGTLSDPSLWSVALAVTNRDGGRVHWQVVLTGAVYFAAVLVGASVRRLSFLPWLCCFVLCSYTLYLKGGPPCP